MTISYPVVDENNTVNSVVLTLRDISESKNTEKALKKEATINKVVAEISREILLPKLPEEKIAQRILSVALSLTKSSTGFVSSKDDQTKKLVWRAYENYSVKTPARISEPCLKDPNTACLNTYLIHKKEAFLSNHLKEFIEKKQLISCNITKENCLMVPALYNKELIGQIYVAGGERPYSENDELILKQLSTIYAISIYRKKMESELIAAKDFAEESNKLKSAFLANMSHEIRTPMNSISGFTELLKNAQLPVDTQQKYLDIIFKSSNQLLSIINNILDISKLEVGQVTLNEREFNINQLIMDTIQTISPNKIAHHQVNFKTSIPLSDMDAIVMVDGPRLQQVLTNLVSNAVKFTENGFVELGYKLENENLTFFVKDTGVGIARQYHHLIFERFGQAEEGHARNYEGAGLGLPICKGFVELMGGKIWFESEENKGSIFMFNIPYKSVVKKIRADNLVAHESDYAWKGKKILLVEDETFSQYFMESMLLPYGVKIVYAEDGFEALNQVRLNPDIDLILMDVRLPRLDGMEATRKIRLLGFTKVIIAQTANALPEDRKACMEAGCTDFVAKPIARVEFLTKLNKYLGS